MPTHGRCLNMKPLWSGSRKFCNPRLLAFLCLCFLSGVGIARFVDPPGIVWLAPAAILAGAAVLWKNPRLRAALLAIVCCALGLMRADGVFYAQRFSSEAKGLFCGTVIEVSCHEYNKSQFVLSNAAFEDHRLDANAVITVYGYFEASPGDRIQCTVSIRPIENYEDATFDYKMWRLSENIAYQAVGSKAQNLGADANLVYLPVRISTELKEVLQILFDDQAAAVTGMTLGGTETMSSDQAEAYRVAGIAHILAVSGLHVGFILLAIQWTMRRKTRMYTWRLILTLSLLWGYCALAGMPTSAVRACVMMSLFVFAQWAGWQYDLVTSLCLAAALIVLVRPAQLFSAGFCLSFSATAGIALFYRSFLQRLMRISWMKKRIAQAVAVWACAQIGVTPFIIVFFRTVPLYGLISNLFIVPLAGVVTLGGLISGLVGAVSTDIAWALAQPVRAVAALIEVLTRWVASLPASQIKILSFGAYQVVLWCVAAAICSRYCLVGKNVKWAVGGACTALLVLLSL